MLENGFIKIYRKILEWEWYDDIPTTRLFIHLLLTVNIKDSVWKGREIPAGSRVISLSKLSKEAGLTQKQIRGSLDKLERANCVAKSATPKYTVITVLNWDSYQSRGQTQGQTKGTQQDKRGANKGQQNKKIREDKRREEDRGASPTLSILQSFISQGQTKGTQQDKRGANKGQQNKKIREDKRREEDRGASPTLSILQSFISENRLNVDAEKFFAYYERFHWRDKNGQPVDWRDKLKSWDARELKSKPVYQNGYAGIRNLADDD